MKKSNVKDLNSALHYLSKCSGVIVWDTIFISFIIFFTACLLAMWNKCNKSAVITLILLFVVLLVTGHLIGTTLWKKRRFDDKAIKYTNKFYPISDDVQYIDAINSDICTGNLLITNLMIITNNYIIGRLSDIIFNPVIIPKSMITQCEFYLLDTLDKYRKAHRIGVLCCYLNNGQKVEYVICRALQTEKTLEQLKNYGMNIYIKK